MNKETVHQNDYSLLRPFDSDKAKAGDPICFASRNEFQVTYVAGPDKSANIVADIDGYLKQYFHTDLRMAPICWVEGRPVYKGDTLWQTSPFITTSRTVATGNENGIYDEKGNWNGSRHLTWKRPTVKREGWCLVNKGNISDSKDKVIADYERIQRPKDLVIMHAEWEEEA